MPLDRRAPRRLLTWFLSPLPWRWQEWIPVRSLERLLLLGVALALLGPWPLALLPFWVALKGMRAEFGRIMRWRRGRKPVEEQNARAIWTVRVAEGWRWKLLRKMGFLWLPAAAPLGGGDIILFDLRPLRQEELELPVFYLAGRVGSPGAGAPRRHRRLVRLAALWTLEDPLPLLELQETYAVWPKAMGVVPGHPAPPPQPLVRTVEPTDEGWLTHRDRLLAKVSVREARKPTWREERKARDLFHKLWGMAHDHADYKKPDWGELQVALKGMGVWI